MYLLLKQVLLQKKQSLKETFAQWLKEMTKAVFKDKLV